MNKSIIPFLTVALSLLCAPVGDASYLLRFKNAGSVATPAYWFENDTIYFYITGGVAGIERKEIDKIEKLKIVAGDYPPRATIPGNIKESPPPTTTEKMQETGKPSGQKEGDITEKDDAKKDPKITGKFRALAKRFDARESTPIDELINLRNDLTVLRDTIVSSYSEEDYPAEMRKIMDMRFFLTDQILRKPKNP
jgi:hypothetical protein